uniref:Uncharacterized protein n=1 Tax=Cacopsylla melanoneura TaxID=428564 RepID=A0A8D8LXT7_9HEMI
MDEKLTINPQDFSEGCHSWWKTSYLRENIHGRKITVENPMGYAIFSSVKVFVYEVFHHECNPYFPLSRSHDVKCEREGDSQRSQVAVVVLKKLTLFFCLSLFFLYYYWL